MAFPDEPTDFSRTTSPTDTVTLTGGWYLLNVYWLSERTRGQVRTGDLADELGVEPGSATEMVGKLADASLLEHEKYGGVEPTIRGVSIAESLAWRQCVVASFFDRVLTYDVDPHTAYRIGYVVPGDGVLRLEDRINHPCTDTCQRIRRGSGGCLVEARTEG